MQEHKNFSDIDWSNVVLPQGMDRAEVERQYAEALKDISKLNDDFKIHFRNKRCKAKYGIMTDDIFSLVWENVRFMPDGTLDIAPVSKLVFKDDQQLYKDIVSFLFPYYKGKPKTIFILARFKIMFVYYLCVAGF